MPDATVTVTPQNPLPTQQQWSLSDTLNSFLLALLAALQGGQLIKPPAPQAPTPPVIFIPQQPTTPVVPQQPQPAPQPPQPAPCPDTQRILDAIKAIKPTAQTPAAPLSQAWVRSLVWSITSDPARDSTAAQMANVYDQMAKIGAGIDLTEVTLDATLQQRGVIAAWKPFRDAVRAVVASMTLAQVTQAWTQLAAGLRSSIA